MTSVTPRLSPRGEEAKVMTGKTLPEHAPQEEPRIRKKIAY
jgi:hypothetical protein